MDLSFKGKAVRITDIDLPRIGSEIKVGEDEIHAFMDVEAAGSGFDSKGRPKILFEPHIFYRNLTGTKQAKAVAAGLAYPKWGTKPYPSDSYPRLIQAIAIDETAALRSASWGLTQILGENSKIAGYTTPQAMVTDFMDYESQHLEATIKVLISMGIDDDLKAHRWAVVASHWNGPGYAKNQYDVKLEKSYNKWAKIADTPWESQTTTIDDINHPVVRRGDKNDSVKILQQLLTKNGFPVKVDGDFGPTTEGLVKKFQAKYVLRTDGVVGPATWALLAV